MAVSIGGGLLLAVSITLVYLIAAISSFKLLARQEQALGFVFADEMEKYGITELQHMSHEWFLQAIGGRITALRRDYIVEMSKITRLQKGVAFVKITGVDGITSKVTNDFFFVAALEQWFLQTAEEDAEWEEYG